jgi:divalent metal cation (Fe/Co/Zn/Cd) transporter
MPSWPFPRREPGRERAVVLLRRLLLLVVAWHLADSVIALATGAVAASPAVVVFGVCSFAVLLGAVVVLWRLSPARLRQPEAEEIAERLVGLSFYLVAALATAGAAWALAYEHDPEAKAVDIVAAALTLAVIPPVGLTVMRLGAGIESAATRAEGYETVLYGLLAGAVLLGLALNAAVSAWWADPIAAIAIAAFALRAGYRLRHHEAVPALSPGS